MSSDTNTQVRLAKRPVGEPAHDDFEITREPVPEAGSGEIVVKSSYLSLDPAMRGWMREGKSYIDPVNPGEVMRALGVGEVVQSSHPDFQVGDTVSGMLGVQEYIKSDGKGFQKVDPNLAPLPTYLNTLGMTGMTAYFGILEVGALKEGDIVLVSGAAGAVGSTVGQIARIKGARAVGIAGGKEKCDYLINELGFDDAIDYKSESIHDGLSRACPKGVDIYFDNVGGDILNAALTRLRMHARVVICGAISQYNNTEAPKGPSNYMSLLVNRARMEGMVVFDYIDRYDVAAKDMAAWMKDGRLKHREHVVEGIEKFPEHLMMLFRGENFGKLVLKV
ncbi:NADP-dependent oxidoreductase [Marinobacter zhanjiangensis]|uniref:NADP-dependent oxidoreductase n=1 Tax=Marinobacter zhanjiangensis TaxID=578215 RepID=A0ABQ3BBE6_9GAMM|nr:NADP-dependent oxidoreductase [Marinobacter zhanjiangensis]GGY82836.1 NADP-dependent oxidoreductase [Marinobacter zhanjiangensis]